MAHAVLVTLLASNALAERVLLVRPAEDEPELVEVFIRLQGELRMQGFETITASYPGHLSSGDLQHLAQVAHADACAALEVAQGQPTVSLWFVDELTAREQSLSISGTNDEDSASVLPLRAVELLRSGILERKDRALPRSPQASVAPARQSSQQAPPTPAVTPHPKDPGLPFSARLGLALAWPSLSLGPSYALEWSAGRRFAKRYELAVLGVVPLSAVRVQATRATAFVSVTQFGIELRAQQPLGRSNFSVEGSGGLSASYLVASSEATAPLEPRRVTGWTANAQLGVGAWYALGSHVSVGSSARLSAPWPRPQIQVDDQLQKLGRPMVLLSAGAAVKF